MKIGFIGLGIMGRPMALNLKAGGHDLFVPDRRSLTDEIRAAAQVLSDAAAVAAAADVIIVMVPDTPDVEHVLFGAHGVAEALTPGKLVIDMSSISPIATKDFAARIAARGCDYVDAPVSGGEVGAKELTRAIKVLGLKGVFIESAKGELLLNAPQARPVKPRSQIGVSRSRSGPYLAKSPAVVRKLPPRRPIPSPSTKIDGSAAIAASSASTAAWMNVICRAAGSAGGSVTARGTA
jgi:hypothetical protein